MEFIGNLPTFVVDFCRRDIVIGSNENFPTRFFIAAGPMPHDHVADESSDLEVRSHQSLALLALFARCLVVGSIVSVASWILVRAMLDQFF